MPFELPKLPYAYDALEPFVDTETMNLHHTKHQQKYLDCLNAYINSDKGAYLKELSAIEVVQCATEGHVRNNGGGYYNHALFWKYMAPPGTANTTPHGALKGRIDQDFGSFDQMKEQFTKAATEVFGSGWAWLGVKKDGSLAITSTMNQDNPMMPATASVRQDVVYEPMIPVFGLDVWEHAYYLKHQNRRAEYISAFWNVANWDQVVENYVKYASKQKPVPMD